MGVSSVKLAAVIALVVVVVVRDGVASNMSRGFRKTSCATGGVDEETPSFIFCGLN